MVTEGIAVGDSNVPFGEGLRHLRSQCSIVCGSSLGTQGVCGGIEEISVSFQQWSVAGSQAPKKDRVRSAASGHAIL